MKSIKIYEEDIKNEYEGCVYCGDTVNGISCCGENHFTTYFDVGDSCVYSIDEVEILPGSRPLTDLELEEKEFERQYEFLKDEYE